MKTLSLFVAAAAFLTSACTPPTDLSANNNSAPTIWSTFPADFSTGVDTHNALTITFSEAMDPSTLNDVTFTLMQQNTPVPATVSFNGITATLVPDDSLLANANFTATISVGATDMAGNPLAVATSWYFRTDTLSTPMPSPIHYVP
jgi:hypothetical protein